MGDSILKARYDFPSPWWDTISTEAKQCVKDLLVIDPKKRFTAQDTMNSTFCKEASGNDLGQAKAHLKKYQATRKLKKAAMGIIAQQRIQKALESLRIGLDKEAGK